MRNYDYREKWKKLLTPEIISLLTAIHEYKGEQRLIAERYADVLTDLMQPAPDEVICENCTTSLIRIQAA